MEQEKLLCRGFSIQKFDKIRSLLLVLLVSTQGFSVSFQIVRLINDNDGMIAISGQHMFMHGSFQNPISQMPMIP